MNWWREKQEWEKVEIVEVTFYGGLFAIFIGVLIYLFSSANLHKLNMSMFY